MSFDEVHIPRVEITVGPPDRRGRWPAPPPLTKVVIDGQLWAVLSFKIEEGMNEERKVTLTFVGNVTLEERPRLDAEAGTGDNPA